MFRIVTHFMLEDMRNATRFDAYSEASDYFYLMTQEALSYGDILSVKMYDVTSSVPLRQWVKP